MFAFYATFNTRRRRKPSSFKQHAVKELNTIDFLEWMCLWSDVQNPEYLSSTQVRKVSAVELQEVFMQSQSEITIDSNLAIPDQEMRFFEFCEGMLRVAVLA